MIVLGKLGVLEIFHRLGAERSVEHVRIKLRHGLVAENDDVVGVDVEAIGGKVRRASKDPSRIARRLCSLDEDL